MLGAVLGTQVGGKTGSTGRSSGFMRGRVGIYGRDLVELGQGDGRFVGECERGGKSHPPQSVPDSRPMHPGTYRRIWDKWQQEGNADAGSGVLQLSEPAY